jgi:predicted DNA-binding transcriptional regulator AlpA
VGHVFERRTPQQGRIVLNSSTTSTPSASAAITAKPAAPSLPETGFVRQPQVLMLVPVSKSTLWRRVRAKTFPAPVKLSPGVTAWRAEDVRGWILEQGA